MITKQVQLEIVDTIAVADQIGVQDTIAVQDLIDVSDTIGVYTPSSEYLKRFSVDPLAANPPGRRGKQFQSAMEILERPDSNGGSPGGRYGAILPL